MRFINRSLAIFVFLFTIGYANSPFAQIAESPETAVVKITAHVEGARKIGSGFIVQLSRDAAYIVTASHVVEGDNKPEVAFFTKKNIPIAASVVGLEGLDPKGLALILVRGEENLFSGLSVLPLAPSMSLVEGDHVILIGFPRMASPWAIVEGRILGRQGREVIFAGPIDEGFSGGPMIKEGRVVGLVTRLAGPYGRATLAASIQLFLEGWQVKTKSKLDNTKIVFVSFVSGTLGNGEVYVMNSDGTNPTPVTHGSFTAISPSWSPDGKKIAFALDEDYGLNIYVMNPDGTNQKRLTVNSKWNRDPSWSPDGKKIAFMSTRDRGAEIYVMNADGTNQKRLTNSPFSTHKAYWSSAPSWSPDGTKIAFMSNINENEEIYVMNADGTNLVRVTNHSAWDGSPSWSPDGMKIAFSSKAKGLPEIYVMNADGTNAGRLTNSPWNGLATSPSWSPFIK